MIKDRRQETIDITSDFNLFYKLIDYCENESFAVMVDFMSKLLVSNPEKRLSSAEALSHPWLSFEPYKEPDSV